ncbi:conserved Plasmodium protein, unknown function [Plasmodium relictum]|uniref:Uncharacterized protein n=1 Tax=Plasmodium relictum TaxID=85471 RepID=A0A1J1HA55_PLARL|nr:conserved Plasmodium protein, unknown function [Plasmodium relictum]CRH02328.1 conserved Plasmodium protein, unknown function [Plasmodium relictum]
MKSHSNIKKEMDNRKYSNKNDINKYEDNSLQKNKEMSEKNDSSLLTIYSFISSYVLREESNYDENDNKYILLENQELQNENDLKKVNVGYYNEKIYNKCEGESESENESEDEDEDEDDENENYEKDKMERKLEIKKKNKEKKNLTIQNGFTSCNKEKYIKKNRKKEKGEKKNVYESKNNELYSNSNIKKKMKNLSKYFMLSIDNINEEENIFKDEKQLSKQMSYYNDAYYYTSEMIYKDNRKNKEKFALYLRLISLFVNIIIGIYLIIHFPHTNSQLEMNFSNKYIREHEKLKEIIRNSIELNKDNNKYMDDVHLNSNILIDEDEKSRNRNAFLSILFRNNKEIDDRDINNNNNENNNNKINAIKTTYLNKTNDTTINKGKYSDINENDVNNLIKEIDIVNLIDDENIMNFIYSEMNKIYKYAIYSFFGELLVISIIVFSLFILKIFIKDNNKFSVILTLYGILYKIFCYFFAHYVLFMGIYILSIYYNIYIHRDIYENSFNFFCYHYVYNNLHIHLLMLFYAFQNIIFTINDTFNCIRMMFIIIKHIIIKIYEKITCKSFITFYELKEDKSFLSINCFNKIKNKCNIYGKCCKDKNCVEIDIDEVHELEYDKSNIPFTNSKEKSYCKNLDIKTYEQSLLNMRNPIFK